MSKLSRLQMRRMANITTVRLTRKLHQSAYLEIKFVNFCSNSFVRSGKGIIPVPR